MKKLFAVSAICFVAGTAWAAPVTYYNEFVIFDGAQQGVASTPHSSPTSYSSNSDTASGYSRRSVVFTDVPAPSILAQTDAYFPLGNAIVQAQGTLSYDIGITGPALTWVPIEFQGRYSFSGHDLAGVTNSTAYSATRVNFNVGTNHPAVFDYGCGQHSCSIQLYDDEYSSMNLVETLQSVDSFAGYFFGDVDVLTDAFGHATTHVAISAGAASFVGLAKFNDRTTAFIDPEFHINAAWLAANPGATLSLPAGVGNALAAVPEPGSLALVAGGLILLSLRRPDQRRQVNKPQRREGGGGRLCRI